MVKDPPGSSALTFEPLMNRVSWNAMTGSVHAPEPAKVCQNGVCRELAMLCHARPNKPETGGLRRPVVTSVTAPKTWLFTEKPAIWTTSWANEPAAAPEPYCIWKGWERFWKVEELASLNV